MEVADLSVVIPAFNSASTIGRAIRSVQAQTRPPREIIVVDDGSRDGTADVARALGHVTVIRQENAGPGAARNRGVRHVSCGLVSFLDADDEYLPHTVATFERVMSEFPGVEAASGATFLVWGGTTIRTPAENAVLRDHRRAAVLPDFFEAARRHLFLVCTNSVVVRTRAFAAVGGFREDVRCGEDVDLWGRLAGRFDWAFVDEPLNVYHFSPPDVFVSASSLRTPLGQQPVDKFMSEDRMRREVRPTLWASYRRYRRDLLCGAARKALIHSEPGRARRLLAGIPPAPPSTTWAATWLLARLPASRLALRAYHAVHPALRRTAQAKGPARTVTGSPTGAP